MQEIDTLYILQHIIANDLILMLISKGWEIRGEKKQRNKQKYNIILNLPLK